MTGGWSKKNHGDSSDNCRGGGITMADQKINIECVTKGFEEATEQIECLA